MLIGLLPKPPGVRTLTNSPSWLSTHALAELANGCIEGAVWAEGWRPNGDVAEQFAHLLDGSSASIFVDDICFPVVLSHSSSLGAPLEIRSVVARGAHASVGGPVTRGYNARAPNA